MRVDQEWEMGSDGKLHGSERLARQVARRPLHYRQEVEEGNGRMVVLFCLCLSAVLWGLAIFGGWALWRMR